MNCHLKIMKNNIDKQFKHNLTFQRNQLIYILKAQIEWIAELKVNKMSMKRNEMTNVFFTTVWWFWLLKFNSMHKHHYLSLSFLIKKSLLNIIVVSALQKLAKHYVIKNYKEWKIMKFKNLDATQYHCLNNVITMHSEHCLHALAVKWSLEYEQL